MKTKSVLSVLFCAMLAAGSVASTAEAAKIGVSMPTQSLQRWNQDGNNLKTELEKAGHQVDLLFGGDNDIPTQVNQIENMIANGDEILVIAAIDGSALTEVLKGAKEKNIPVISYDRLILNTDAVSYYATFDNYKVGVTQGTFIENALKLKEVSGPLNIEFFTGPTDDNNVNFFWGGAMSVLQPYLDSGKLVCPSGQTTKEQAATLNWNLEEAQKRMENIISSVGYEPGGTPLAAVLCSNDAVANGVTNALLANGFDASNMPVITGQDCDRPSVKNIKQGYQSMSVFKDTRTLAAQVVKMVNAIATGQQVEVNDTTTYNNGTGVIPSFLCEPVNATKDNYHQILVESGYYKEDEI